MDEKFRISKQCKPFLSLFDYHLDNPKVESAMSHGGRGEIDDGRVKDILTSNTTREDTRGVF